MNPTRVAALLRELADAVEADDETPEERPSRPRRSVWSTAIRTELLAARARVDAALAALGVAEEESGRTAALARGILDRVGIDHSETAPPETEPGPNDAGGWIARYGDRAVVYFVQPEGGGPIKIGFSGSIRSRLDAFATSCPFPLRVLGLVPGAMTLEASLHEEFRHTRIRGEWFHPTPDLLARIAALTGAS